MVDRTVVFYRWQSVSGQPPFVPSDVARQLDEDVLRDPSSALVVGSDTTTAVSVVSRGSASEPTRLQLLAVRTEENQPVQWSPGQTIRSLIMQDGHFATDVTHVTIWPDGFAAQDWHGHAPRLGRLAHFIRSQSRGSVVFNNLYRPDMLQRLERLRGRLRKVEMALTSPEYADQDRAGVIETLLPAVYGHRAPSITVNFGMGRFGPRDRYLDDQTEDAVYSIAENAQEMVDRLVVHGYDPQAGRVVRVNLLSERIGHDVSVPPNPEAATLPDEDAIFAEVLDIRRQLDDEGLLSGALEAQAMRGR